MSGGDTVSALQAAWLPLRSALDTARRELDAEAFAVLVEMLGIQVARWEAERLECGWRTAA